MALDYRRADRDQVFLLPPDMRDWLGAKHLVWFVLSAIEGMDLSSFKAHARLGGTGRAPIDPQVLLSLLVYGYCMGERSSRQLERLCEVDVAFRLITVNQAPDHTTIARFRARNEAGLAEVFTHVLGLCAQAGMARMGVVAIDGTKIAADAALSANVTEEKLRADVEQMIKEAAATDAGEDARFGDTRGDELPEELTDPKRVKARSAAMQARKKAALELLEQERLARQKASDAQQAKADRYNASMADPQQQPGIGRPPAGTDLVRLADKTLERQISEAQKAVELYRGRELVAAEDGGKVVGRRPVPVDQRGGVRRARENLKRRS